MKHTLMNNDTNVQNISHQKDKHHIKHKHFKSLEENAYSLLTIEEKLIYHMRSLTNKLRRHGHKDSQNQILFILEETGSITQRKLMDITRTKAGSLSEILSKMVSSGSINRYKNQTDRRNTNICLTESGQVKVKELKNERFVFIESLFDELSLLEKEQLLLLLNKIDHE